MNASLNEKQHLIQGLPFPACIYNKVMSRVAHSIQCVVAAKVPNLSCLTADSPKKASPGMHSFSPNPTVAISVLAQNS